MKALATLLLLAAPWQRLTLPGQPIVQGRGFDQYLLTPGPPDYLIPESGTVLTHANATDLKNGTAKVGRPWSKVGTVPFVATTLPRPSVGPFTAGNYFAQPPGAGSPFNFGTGSWTIVVASYNYTAPAGAVVISNQQYGNGGGDGFSMYENINLFCQLIYTPLAIATVSTGSPPATLGLDVEMVGYDSVSGLYYIEDNNGPIGSGGSSAISINSSYQTALGANGLGGSPDLNAGIIEVYASTQVPSAAAFSTIYSTIKANAAPPPKYLVPDTVATIVHVNGTDLNAGSAKTGPPWTKNGTITYDPNAYPLPSVGPLGDTNYLTLPYNGGNPLGLSSSFSRTIIAALGVTGTQEVFFSGPNDYAQLLQSTSSLAVNVLAPVVGTNSGGAYVNSMVNVFSWGYDAIGNNLYTKANGSATVTVASTGAVTPSALTSFLGRYQGTGTGFSGKLMEFWASTDRPSDALFTSIYSSALANLQKPGYVIPESGTVLTHVSGYDLAKGTAKVGGAWTINNSPTFNALDTPRPSVGGFSTTNYFYQTSSPASVSSGPFTSVVIVSTTSYASQGAPFVVGPLTGAGYGVQPNATASPSPYRAFSNGAIVATTANSVAAGVTNIVIFGVDAGGNAFLQINGGTVATGTGAVVSAGGTAYLGNTTNGGVFNGNIYELMVSTAVPSVAAFAALYSQIEYNL